MLRSILIRFLRFGFRVWPFMHGRGWILRAAKLLLGSGPVRFDIGDGTFIEGPLSDWVIVWTFMRGHERDAPFRKSLALLRPGDVAIDAGANLGVWSLLAAKRGARVEAFEPVPAMAARLRRHVEMNAAKVNVHSFALGAERTTLPFFAVPDGNTGASSLARHHDASVEMHVDVVPLDEIIDRADFLKVDVEGAEILIFRGAQRLLSSDAAPIVFFEVVDRFCRDFGTTSSGVKQFLIDCGYGIYRWDGRRFTPVGVDESHEQEDLFALKPSHTMCQSAPPAHPGSSLRSE
ncbi:MAG TPA: FkbM family methyltransferase [Thermoanaerobaculia bacterium]|jgi:FkbM family methyltransferase|nr:FkbM family methyltransferase [Thermoanaerobaculia bacterium]